MKDICPFNPTSTFTSGSDTETFSYDPGFGAKPFYVYVAGNSWVAMSVIIFAQDLAHVKKIIHQAHLHVRRCIEQRITDDSNISHHIVDMTHRLEKWESIDLAVHHKANPKQLQCEIRPFDGTHMLKVAWAGNDTI